MTLVVFSSRIPYTVITTLQSLTHQIIGSFHYIMSLLHAKTISHLVDWQCQGIPLLKFILLLRQELRRLLQNRVSRSWGCVSNTVAVEKLWSWINRPLFAWKDPRFFFAVRWCSPIRLNILITTLFNTLSMTLWLPIISLYSIWLSRQLASHPFVVNGVLLRALNGPRFATP